MRFSWKTLAVGALLTFPASIAPATAASASPLPAGRAATAARATAVRSLTCTQTTVSRAQYKRSVSGTVDSGSTLLSATVTRVATGQPDISTNSPALDNTLFNGYYLQHYGWNGWRLGTVNRSPATTYYLFLPSTALPNGSAFDGMVYINYDQAGSNSFRMSCTVG